MLPARGNNVKRYLSKNGNYFLGEKKPPEGGMCLYDFCTYCRWEITGVTSLKNKQTKARMAKIQELRSDPVISELMELVARVRSGEIISMTVITTDKAGEITAKKICEPSLLARRYWA